MNWGELIVDLEPAGTVTLLQMLKDYMGIEDGTQDAELERSLELAGNVIETYLDRIVAKRPVDEYFQHHFGTVELHEYPVDTVEPLNVFLDGTEQTDFKAWLKRDKVANLSRIGRRPDMPFDWRQYEQVTVTYTAGYDPIPSDLAQAIVYTAAPVFQSKGSGNMPGGGGGSGEVKSMSIYDVGSITYDVGSSSSSSGSGTFGAISIIPDSAAEMIARYKRMAA